MIRGGARSGILSMSTAPAPGHVTVALLPGATLIGMRVSKKVPLLRVGREITVVVVRGATRPSRLDAV